MTMTQRLLPIAAAAAGLLLASAARADLCLIREHAERLGCQMDELRGDFRNQFRRAANYGELRSTALQIESSANRIARLARSGRSLCEIREEAAGVLECLRRLDLMVAQARFRAAQGLDPPLRGCTLHVDAKLAAACETARCISRLANGGTVVMVPGWQTARVPVHGAPGGYDGYPQVLPGGPGGFNGYGGFGGPMGPVPYHGDGLRGTAPADPGLMPTPATVPGWMPGGSGGPSRGALPPGETGYPEEIGPPLGGWSRTPRGNGTGLPGTVIGSLPVGVYGQRGNGIQLTGNGVVLRIGGQTINLR